ncbi:venom acid phosphatase Acph-1-like [Anthonomus grandis grandis]|uniref:venom acid phosphatase Acph-1-like n=1 Tax=Anthonomus grandis grandis TaxID=2921223 RepID=UPI0021652C5F|nr:venom acid phosphatase Acph-1-like [Anthonomus grandis grandis]
MAKKIITFIALFASVGSLPKDLFMPDEFVENNLIFNDPVENHVFYQHNHQHQNDPVEISRTLMLSHVIFRHGNRTPNSFQELYPNDPYLNETYYPYGLGQLTNAGKLREFSIGTSLRRRYKYFLNDLFLPEEVEAVSTDYNRTKASLELALAGLFPPKGELVWNKALMWQPVPYNYVPRNRDKVLMGVECPTYLRMYEEVKGSWEMQIEYKKFRKVFSYISRNSGLNVTSFQEIYNLYFGLSTEQENGLFLPPWTQKVWPRLIIDLAIREYSVMMANDDLRKMASGYLLKKILSDTAKKISDRNSKRKIHFYSAHENNVAQLLILLDVFWPHIPNYGAHVILEVHRINGEIGIKVFYQNYETDFPQLLKIPECEEFCPLDQFIRLFSKYVPDDGLCGY